MPLPLLPTTLVGSYAQPDWLLDRKNLAGRFPPRVRAKELWRVAPEFLDQAQDDATILAIRDQERAGLDVEQAFTVLRRYARDHNLLLTEVARSAIQGTLPTAALAIPPKAAPA